MPSLATDQKRTESVFQSNWSRVVFRCHAWQCAVAFFLYVSPGLEHVVGLELPISLF